MIIQAAGRFTCTHRYVATDVGGKWLFACEACGHRTEQLPLALDTQFGQVLAFRSPSIEAELSAVGASALQPQSPLIQSA